MTKPMIKPDKNIEISRKYTFSSGENLAPPNRLSGSDWSMEVTIQGPLDPKTQLVFNLIDLDDLVLPILKRIDRKILNIEIEVFQGKVISPEILSEYLFHNINQELKGRFRNLQLVKVKTLRIGDEEWGNYSMIKGTEDL